MSEKPQQVVTLTFEQLNTLLTEARKPNALEERRIQEQIAADKRRAESAILLARAEEEAKWRRQQACSHCKDDKGNMVARGAGQWVTSGQGHGDGTWTLICQICATTWHWLPNASERDYLDNAGCMGFAPPQYERLLNKDDFMRQRPAHMPEPKPRPHLTYEQAIARVQELEAR